MNRILTLMFQAVIGVKCRNFQGTCFHLLILLLLVLFFFLSVTAVSAQNSLPYIEPSECPIHILKNMPVSCATLFVPADYEHPHGEWLALPVIIIHSHSDNPAPDPILYTEGGPGYTSLTAVWWLAGSQMLDERDIIVLEQRGNIHAQPDLTCDSSIWWDVNTETTPCLNSLHERGIDLTQFNTTNIAADIAALQQALEIEKWNLYGSSYSTRLMQLVMNMTPESIRSVVLQSVSPLDDLRYNHDPGHSARVIQLMLDDCAADAACDAGYPQLESDLYTLIEKLNDDPIPFVVMNPETGEPISIAVDGERLIDWMVGDAFYGPTYPPHKSAFLPFLIHMTARGHSDLLYPWLQDELNRSNNSPMAIGLYFAVNCQDDAPGITAEYLANQTAVYPQLDGFIRHDEELAVCQLWDLPPGPPLGEGPIDSDIPVLILAGSYDPITSPEWGQALSEKLNNSQYFEFPASGHNVGTDNPCAESIKHAFVADPTAVLNPSCLDDMPNPTYILPDDIVFAPGAYNIVHDADMGNPERGKLWIEILAGADLMIFLVELGYLVVKTAVWLIRGRPKQAKAGLAERMGHPLAGITAVVAWLVMFLITNINNYLLLNSPITLYFGFAASYPPVRLLAAASFLFLCLTTALVVILFMAWKKRYWSTSERLFYSLVTLSAVAYSLLLIRWDLHTLLLA